jgi:hypothetical protein
MDKLEYIPENDIWILSAHKNNYKPQVLQNFTFKNIHTGVGVFFFEGWLNVDLYKSERIARVGI